MNQAIKKIEVILKSVYTVDNFIDFAREIFPDMQLVSPKAFRQEYSNFSSHIVGSAHVANYTDPDGKKLLIHSVELKKETYVENSRSTQRSYAKKLMEAGGADAALIAYYTAGEPKWRLSFVRLDYEIKFENGKLNTMEKMTPAKRYSYLVGEDEPCHTAISRFHRFIVDDSNMVKPTLDDIEEAFSVEKVTEEFFKLYSEKFYQLRDWLEQNEDFVIEASQHNFTAAQFAKKLMGQIVFLYFLQKKGWLGVSAWPKELTAKEFKAAYYAKGAKSRELIPRVYIQQGEDRYCISGRALKEIPDEDERILAACVKGEPWGTGSQVFMRKLFEVAVARKANFFDDFLEPLFYNALNVNRGTQGYDPALHCRIPFLSGGLFEPIDGYEWENNDFAIPNEVFSNRKDENDREGTGILDIFDRYNFTMSEDEPLEREVAIDPEMLGKVFENLLEDKDRKSKGAFYTPREIVHYMCQETLIAYLVKETGLKEQDIRDFILLGDFFKDADTSKDKRQGNNDMLISEEIFKVNDNGEVIVNRLDDIDKALANIRVADPAVGSGAFPLGMLNEIVRARQNISAYMAITMHPQQIKLMYNNERSPYRLKVETIKNCIFAADIEPSAVDIARLRLWLSLVIDDEINPEAQSDLEGHATPIPLPNLECNILCGNSLIDEFEGVSLINNSDLIGTAEDGQMDMYQQVYDAILPSLIETQDELFKCTDTKQKPELLHKIENIKDELAKVQMQTLGKNMDWWSSYKTACRQASRPFVLWQVDFARVFKEKGGFDVVIGNPPYIGFHKVPNKEYYKEKYYTANGKYDFYVLFIERGMNLLASGGWITYICPSYFYKRNYGKNIRELLLEKMSLRYIADFSDYQIFDEALTYTCIFCAQKIRIEDNKIKILPKKLSDDTAYYISQKSLKEPSWNIENPENNSILNKLLNHNPAKLSEIVKSISQGIVTGYNDIFYIPLSTIQSLDLELEVFEKAYKGKDIRNGNLIDNSMYVFYPYMINDTGKTVCLSEDYLQKNCPNTYKYLLEHKGDLLSREYFVKSSKKWYELWNQRKKEHFLNKKFVFPELSLYNDFVLVEECYYTDSACGMELREKYEKYYRYMFLYLNSDIITYIYKKISVPKANGYSIYKNAFLKELPIIFPGEQISVFDTMTQEEFNKYIRNVLDITMDEDNTIIQTLEKYGVAD